MFSSDYSTAVHLTNVQYECVVKIDAESWQSPLCSRSTLLFEAIYTSTDCKYAARLRISKADQWPRQSGCYSVARTYHTRKVLKERFWSTIGTLIWHVAKRPRASIKERCCWPISTTTRKTYLRLGRSELIEDGCARTHRSLLFLPLLLPFLPTSGLFNMKPLLQYPSASQVD